MLAVERIRLIQEVIQEEKQVSVSSLSNRFQVSEETIRRDLEKITKSDPTIVRVHGGAYKAGVFDSEMPVQLRETLSVDRKKTIANACISLIHVNDSLMLDCSTTALYLAMLIRQRGYSVTVITNSLRIIEVLQDCDQIKLILLGGNFRRNTQSFIGYDTTHALEQYRADRCFISCTGIHLTFGVTDNSENESQVRQMMMQNSKERFLLVDTYKFGRSYLSCLADPSEFDAVITDVKPDSDWITYFDATHTRLIY
ncbi:MAG: DeoR/GlpR transcriptional regulator [Oscillospiraceae bacterium]|nr:DeoR/GlpR transcriptional regulator [Oscillospiraceae bacterium]